MRPRAMLLNGADVRVFGEIILASLEYLMFICGVFRFNAFGRLYSLYSMGFRSFRCGIIKRFIVLSLMLGTDGRQIRDTFDSLGQVISHTSREFEGSTTPTNHQAKYSSFG